MSKDEHSFVLEAQKGKNSLRRNIQNIDWSSKQTLTLIQAWGFVYNNV